MARDLEPLWQAEIRRAAAAGVQPSFARACAMYCRYYWAVAFALRFTQFFTDTLMHGVRSPDTEDPSIALLASIRAPPSAGTRSCR